MESNYGIMKIDLQMLWWRYSWLWNKNLGIQDGNMTEMKTSSKSDHKISSFLVPRFWNWIVCQMIAYDETSITTNFQVELVIGLRGFTYLKFFFKHFFYWFKWCKNIRKMISNSNYSPKNFFYVVNRFQNLNAFFTKLCLSNRHAK